MLTRKKKMQKTRNIWGMYMRTPSTALFHKAILQRYTERIQSEVRLICNEDILNYLGPRYITEQSRKCCANKIKDTYKSNSFIYTLVKRKRSFELLSAIDSNNTLLGFIICELGECKMLENTWSVRLVCVKKTTKMSSLLLLGAMMYAIKEKGGKFAVLELAGGYTNIQGFVSYSKMGFIKNLSLYNYRPRERECFYDPANLPMYVSLEHLTQPNIIDLVTGVKEIRLTAHQDDTGLFEKYQQSHIHPRKDLEYWNADYRSKIRRLPNEVVLSPQRYHIGNTG
jgi:hypothetical protein